MACLVSQFSSQRANSSFFPSDIQIYKNIKVQTHRNIPGLTQCLLKAQDDGWARGWIYSQVLLIPHGELNNSLVQVALFWHVSVNRCEQEHGGAKCQCLAAGTKRGLHAQEMTIAVLCGLPIKNHCCLAPIYHSTCEQAPCHPNRWWGEKAAKLPRTGDALKYRCGE